MNATLNGTVICCKFTEYKARLDVEFIHNNCKASGLINS